MSQKPMYKSPTDNMKNVQYYQELGKKNETPDEMSVT